MNNSYLNIRRFSNQHFGYYYCLNNNVQKSLALSPNLFEFIKNSNLPKQDLSKYKRSVIEILKGKYVGDNITLICRIGQGKQIFFRINLKFLSFKIFHKEELFGLMFQWIEIIFVFVVLV
jgi:hypothetical protein